jgi:DNA-binding Lrp family transcriptional regulator
MTKNNVNKVKTENENEKAVIKVLLNNARKTSKEIAKEIGITRQTVSKIIKKFEDDGRIWGYSTIMEPELLDNHFFLVFIKLKEDFEVSEMMRKIIESDSIKIGEKLNFRYTAYLHGRFNFITSLYASDIIEAERIINKMVKPYRKYILDLYIHQTLITFRRFGFTNPNLKNEINSYFNI